MGDSYTCPSCDSPGLSVFYEVQNVPVHSVLLMRTLEKAVNCPTGDIVLGRCFNCGFVTNISFDPKLHHYSLEYEATQAYSPTFSAFHQDLAERLIDRHNLHNKEIIEIGCGHGEFLILLCELGGNRGIGFDPAHVSGRLETEAMDRITFIKDFYSERYAHLKADFICCKMTLEHIPHTAEFVSTVRRSLGDRSDAIVFFQVPNVSRILSDLAFWDIYYEHCSYFGSKSLSNLFRINGFDVLDVATEYDDQYLLLEARPSRDSLPAEDVGLPDDPQSEVTYFEGNYEHKIEHWSKVLDAVKRNGRRAVVWGSGSKAVAFLTTLKIQQEIGYVVDINPYRQGTYMAGTGHQIVSPEFLRQYRPEIVIVMNPIYQGEIKSELDRMDLKSTTVLLVE